MLLQTTGPFLGIDDDVEPGQDGQNERPPYARFVIACAEGQARIAATHHRTLFCQHNLNSSPGVQTPLHRYRYEESWGNSKYLKYGVLALPPFAAAPGAGAVPSLSSSIGGSVGMWEINAAAAEPDDLRYKSFTESHAGPALAYVARSVNTTAGPGATAFRPTAVAIEDRPMLSSFGPTDTGDGCCVNPQRFRTGSAVIDAPLEAYRAAEHEEWHNHRPIVAAWSADDFALPGSSVQVTGGVVPVCLMENPPTTVAGGIGAGTRGEICPTENAGRPEMAVPAVNAQVAVYADVTAGNAQVDFVSSLNTVTVGPFAAGAPAWYAANGLLLDTSIEYDRVVILGAPDNALNTLRAWAWMIQIDPV